MADGPGYWMYETSGVLRPALDAYLHGGPLSADDIAALRAYLRQWIMAGCWDTNPYADDEQRQWLASMRARIEELVSREAIDRWLDDAIDCGIDPL